MPRAVTAFAALSAFGAATLGAVGVADTRAFDAPSHGTVAEVLAIDDVWVDAERVFAKVDVDRNGHIDVDEYAAQAVVFAGMVRLDGSVLIDGRETLLVGLPKPDGSGLGTAERAAIDAVARAHYYDLVAGQGVMTPRQWIALRIKTFDEADRNGDGQLTGRELGRYANGYAQYAG